MTIYGIEPIEMKEVKTTDPNVIFKDKGRCISPSNLLIRSAEYDTVRARNVLPLHQINTVKREMKIWRMLLLTNNTGEDYG